MGVILTAAGWVIFLPSLGMAYAIGMQLYRLARAEQWNRAAVFAVSWWAALCGMACGAGLAGFAPTLFAVTAGVAAAVVSVAVIAGEMWHHADRTIAKVIRAAWWAARFSVREALSRGGGKAVPLAPRRSEKPPPPPKRPDVRAVPTPRPAPAPRNGPVAAAALPRAVAQGRVSTAWAQVISSIADFEPEDDAEFLSHWQEQASGLVGVADAMLDSADYLDGELGLAPVIVGAVFDSGDEVSEAAAAVALINERLLKAYGGAREDAANGHPLPRNGRWVTGEDAG